jgi:hypothetical protein
MNSKQNLFSQNSKWNRNSDGYPQLGTENSSGVHYKYGLIHVLIPSEH